jgi:outer membrane protein assembly factor BamB
VSGGRAALAYMLPGPPLRPLVTDGSDARTLVVRTGGGDRLRGLDLRNGRMRWTRPYPAASLEATALVDGILLLDDGPTVTALDVRTGDAIWRERVDSRATDGAALTDGQVVVLPVRAEDGALHLAAIRMADGTTVWRTPAPAGTVSVGVVDHRLVVSTEDEVIGLG